jgi:tRNA modification GTPase
MDLLEAEGLSDLLTAQTDAQHRQAMSLVLGEASSRYTVWRQRLISLLSHCEAAIDFVEETDVAAQALGRIREGTRVLVAELRTALDEAESAKAIREGVIVVLAGPPNVGKSSVLNRLARRDAAIVSDRPGTTRDAIEVLLDIGGVPVILTDTAGLREESHDEIEREGMARTLARGGLAAIVLWIVAPDVEGSDVPDWPQAKIIRVENKVDLVPDGTLGNSEGTLRISARDGRGIDELVGRLAEELQSRYHLEGSSVVVRERHRTALTKTIRLLNDSLKLDERQLELICEDLRAAAEQLGAITGAVDVEEVLGAIFAEFCIGK